MSAPRCSSQLAMPGHWRTEGSAGERSVSSSGNTITGEGLTNPAPERRVTGVSSRRTPVGTTAGTISARPTQRLPLRRQARQAALVVDRSTAKPTASANLQSSIEGRSRARQLRQGRDGHAPHGISAVTRTATCGSGLLEGTRPARRPPGPKFSPKGEAEPWHRWQPMPVTPTAISILI